jgi:hypothetical protein
MLHHKTSLALAYCDDPSRGLYRRYRGQFFSKKLQGDMPMRLEVFGFAHYTHPAATELREDAIVRDGLADHDGKDTSGDAC